LEGGKDYAKDWDRAVERLLDEMPREPLSFEMVTTSNFVDDAENIKQQWSEFSVFAKEQCQASKAVEDKELCDNLNIDLSIKITNFPDTANYELLLLGQEIPIDPDQYVMWHSSQATNFTNYKNTRIDSLLEKGRQTVDLVERKTFYQEFQQYLLEDPPSIHKTISSSVNKTSTR
jgi:peptide/nickel transport system substrate-binding protein